MKKYLKPEFKENIVSIESAIYALNKQFKDNAQYRNGEGIYFVDSNELKQTIKDLTWIRDRLLLGAILCFDWGKDHTSYNQYLESKKVGDLLND